MHSHERQVEKKIVAALDLLPVRLLVQPGMLLAFLAAREALSGAQVSAHHHPEVLLSSAAPQPGSPQLTLKPAVAPQSVPPWCRSKPLSFLKTISLRS